MLHPDRAAAAVVPASSCSTATKGRSSPPRDYVRALAEQIGPWVPGGLFALGTDGIGRSEDRAKPAAALRGRRRVHHHRGPVPACASSGKVEREARRQGDRTNLGIDPEKIDPVTSLDRPRLSELTTSSSPAYAAIRRVERSLIQRAFGVHSWRSTSRFPTWARTSSRATSSTCWSTKATRSQADQSVIEIETDKAMVELPCPHRRQDHQGPRARRAPRSRSAIRC